MTLWNTVWNPYSFLSVRWILPMLVVIGVNIILAIAVLCRIKRFRTIICAELLLFWLFTIISATLVDRRESVEAKVNLELFWTIRYAWEHRSGLHWYYIIGNIGLFIPLGFLIPFNFRRLGRWERTAVAGFLLSLAIETCQYRFKLGLFELDDILHNTWGTVLGYCVYRLAVPSEFYGERRLWGKVFSFLMIAGTVVGFAVLLWRNLPDWSGIF